MSHLQRAFERWYLASYVEPNLVTDVKGAYMDPTTKLAWAAWKGGRAYIAPTVDVQLASAESWTPPDDMRNPRVPA